MSGIKIGLAQINTTVGDLSGNLSRLLNAAERAYEQGVDVLVTPELALTGYPAEDLYLRPDFLQRQAEVFEHLCSQLAKFEGLHVVLGHARRIDKQLYNVASVIVDGRVTACYCKRELPDYGVFDERRYFATGKEPVVFEVKGVRLAINICEDAWYATAPRMAAEHGAQVLLVLNGSPYSTEKQALRDEVISRHCKGMTVVYVNQIGGQDELVFDGGSFVLDPHGRTVMRLPVFKEALDVIQLDGQGLPQQSDPPIEWPEQLEQVYGALMLALRDYMGKTGFKTALLGLSGGLDSALVLAIAADALGPINVRTVMMPSRYTADISQTDARTMAEGLGVQYDEINIAPLIDAYDAALGPAFAGLQPDVTEENIQARIRGNLLMALSNKFGSLVISTGNKSELATGYCTLYGDMCGGFSLLKDVPKTMAYDLAKWRNQRSQVIPERIITRPPSAELRPDQTDQDSLPPYDILDAIVYRFMERNESIDQIEEAGFDRAVVDRVARLIRISEYKRRQGAIGPKITTRAFGRDWRYPVANGYRP